MDIWRYALAQLRGGWRRTLASALAVLTAVTSFVLLTGSATTERLVVTDTLNRNRGAYDILVRPAGSATRRSSGPERLPTTPPAQSPPPATARSSSAGPRAPRSPRVSAMPGNRWRRPRRRW